MHRLRARLGLLVAGLALVGGTVVLATGGDGPGGNGMPIDDNHPTPTVGSVVPIGGGPGR